MDGLRKILTFVDVAHADAHGARCPPVTRVAMAAVFRNPLAGAHHADLTPLFEIGAALGAMLADRAVALLPGPAIAYGKGALVGAQGDMEQGGAVVHPRLGAPMRAAVGGGKAVIPSNVKIAGPGATLDVPLGHKDDPWSFDHFDTLCVTLADAPLPGEIAMVLAYADRGRPIPRCGAGPAPA